MAVGRKTGGRKAGVPNRATRTAEEIMARLGCDPIEGMVRIAEDTANDPALRGKMYAELAKYRHPQRRAVEHSGPDGDAIRLIVASISDKP